MTSPPPRRNAPFQPTLPARGATAAGFAPCRTFVFQPTLPARGATLTNVAISCGSENFNPRSPHGERHNKWFCRFQNSRISTHAPRTGSDVVV